MDLYYLQTFLESFELEIDYSCQGVDRTKVKDGTCHEVSSEEDEGTIFIVNGKCPGNSPAVEESVRCGNNIFLQCQGGCLR